MGKSCYEYAIGIITKYPKTEKELRIKLYQQGYDSEIVLRTLEKLKSENFVNDLLFAESYLNSEVMKKWKSLFIIKKKLELKGIDKQLLNKLSDKYAEDIQEGILQGIQREIRNYKKRGTDGFEIIQKLMRKGYKLSDIKKVIKENTKENEEY